MTAVGAIVAAAIVGAALAQEGPRKPRVNSPIPPEDRTGLAPAKQSVLATLDAEQTSAWQSPHAAVPKDALTPRPLNTQPPVTPGILNKVNSFGTYSIANAWQGMVNGERVLVNVGTHLINGKGTGEGVVIMVTYDEFGRTTAHGGTYLAADNNGGLRIRSVDGTVLTLARSNGDLFTFDLLTRELKPATGATAAPGAAAGGTPLPVGTGVASP